MDVCKFVLLGFEKHRHFKCDMATKTDENENNL